MNLETVSVVLITDDGKLVGRYQAYKQVPMPAVTVMGDRVFKLIAEQPNTTEPLYQECKMLVVDEDDDPK